MNQTGMTYENGKAFSEVGYHQIANEMKELGYDMAYTTARNIFLSAMAKFAKEIKGSMFRSENLQDTKSISLDPRFQSAIEMYLKDILINEEHERNKNLE